MRAKSIVQSSTGKKIYSLLLCISLTAVSLNEAVAAEAAWTPNKNVELVAGAAAGGGVDRTIRLMQRIMQGARLLEVSTSVVNKPGGGGSIAWAYLNQHVGDPHYLSIITPSLLTNRITGSSPLEHQDFTALALLFSEYLGFAVKSDSSLGTARDLLDQLKKDPASLSIAIGTTFNQVGIALVAKSSGIDIRKLKIVSFRAGAESTSALLGGHVDVVASSPANLAELLKAGRIRALALAAPQRLTGVFADVPTWRELGVDAVATNWRGVISPRGISEAQAAYWETILAKLTQTADWKSDLDRFFFVNTYMTRTETKRFLDAQYGEMKVLLTELGLAK